MIASLSSNLTRLSTGIDHPSPYPTFRVYATLMFVFVIDEAESELAVLDLIQVLVEVLDKSFENVCELDLIFNPDKVSVKCKVKVINS
jgi:hypothetical protein